jgi:hypothetical protein
MLPVLPTAYTEAPGSNLLVDAVNAYLYLFPLISVSDCLHGSMPRFTWNVQGALKAGCAAAVLSLTA